MPHRTIACPGCGSPTTLYRLDDVDGMLVGCTLLGGHVYVLRGRDLYEAPTEPPAGWVPGPTEAPVARAAPVFDTCPRCERQVEVVWCNRAGDPWEFVDHRRMREDARGSEPCPASGRTRARAAV